MITNPDCYIYNNRGHKTTFTPAKVISETKSTVTVEVHYGESLHHKTFNKQKRYGEQVWEDPRISNRKEYYINSISERGASRDFYPDSLTFNMAGVERAIKLREIQTEVTKKHDCLRLLNAAIDAMNTNGYTIALDSVRLATESAAALINEISRLDESAKAFQD